MYPGRRQDGRWEGASNLRRRARGPGGREEGVKGNAGSGQAERVGCLAPGSRTLGANAQASVARGWGGGWPERRWLEGGSLQEAGTPRCPEVPKGLGQGGCASLCPASHPHTCTSPGPPRPSCTASYSLTSPAGARAGGQQGSLCPPTGGETGWGRGLSQGSGESDLSAELDVQSPPLPETSRTPERLVCQWWELLSGQRAS